MATAGDARIHSVLLARMHPKWSSSKHLHEHYHEAYLVCHGQMTTHLPDGDLVGRLGEWIVVPRGLTHENTVTCGPCRLAMLRWTGGDDVVAACPLAYRTDSSGRLAFLHEWMMDLQQAQEDTPCEQLVALLPVFLQEMVRLAGRTDTDLVEQVRAHVRRHLHEPMRLEDLAEAACLSKYHFLRKFREQTGLTPMRFVRHIRVAAAQNLIRHSRLSLDAIAEQTGFSSQSHMHQAFRQQTDQSPGQFRRA